MAEIKWEVIESVGEISVTAKGWHREVNLVSWNDNPAKIDIRDWDDDHQRMSKGVTFTDDEALELQKILTNYLEQKGLLD